MQIKSRLGKLQLRRRLPEMIRENEQQNGFVVLSITSDHVYYLDQIPDVHNDPFDRLIASVACMEGATLLSADAVFNGIR